MTMAKDSQERFVSGETASHCGRGIAVGATISSGTSSWKTS